MGGRVRRRLDFLCFFLVAGGSAAAAAAAGKRAARAVRTSLARLLSVSGAHLFACKTTNQVNGRGVEPRAHFGRAKKWRRSVCALQSWRAHLPRSSSTQAEQRSPEDRSPSRSPWTYTFAFPRTPHKVSQASQRAIRAALQRAPCALLLLSSHTRSVRPAGSQP